MSDIKMPEDKLDVFKLMTTQHIKVLNQKGANLKYEKLTVGQLLEMLGFKRPEAGATDAISVDEEPEGWLCGADSVCGLNKSA
ncbi:hypothetical protein ACQR0V_26440 [Bradyrhizobium sp. HKCCYLS2058]|uniref:hypothetical protein n=1 Tax=Bradyrhizobium TaxID=374 RepID=UPI0029168823|nr:hypothetical protein [Bradyrhizobium sp. SZCCHNR1015]